MELRDLRTFLAVARHGNVSRAAEELHVSQPAISEQLRKLEDELGAPLFDRTSRGVHLTDAGAALLPHARAVLERAEAAVESVRLVERGVAGTLTIGFIDSAALGILPPLVRRFAERAPAVTLRLRELGTKAQLEALERDELDVGILRGPVWGDVLDGRRVATESLLVALPATHPLARAERVRMADLRDDGFVGYPADRGAGLAEETLRLAHDAGFEPRVVQAASEITTICGIVAAGLGVAIVPASVAVLALDAIVYRPLDDPGAALERWLAWRRDRPLAVVREFVAALDEITAWSPFP